MGKLRVYCLKTLKKPLIYPLGNTPSAPSVYGLLHHGQLVRDKEDAEGEIAEDAVEEEII